MKILIVHSYYSLRGGEDAVFEQETKLLADNHQVNTLVFKNNTGIRGLFQFLATVWNVSAAKKLKDAIRSTSPDVIHFHNLHFASGPILIRTAKKSGVPAIVTLHNYRLLCPSATLLYNEKIYTDSLHAAFPWDAVKKKLYRNSSLQTFWLAFTIWLHKKIGTWAMPDRYIVLTAFAGKVFKDSSFPVPASKFVVKPNFTPTSTSIPKDRGTHFLFVGRLSEEKGIKVLLETFSKSEELLQIRIAGDGPLKQDVIQAAERSANITYLGSLNAEGVRAQMSECTALIFPSIWYEGMPMTILESLSIGTPVIASDLGAMSTMIVDGYNGFLFQPSNPRSLLQYLQKWQAMTADEQAILRKNCVADHFEKYSPQAQKILSDNIYAEVVSGISG